MPSSLNPDHKEKNGCVQYPLRKLPTMFSGEVASAKSKNTRK